MSIKNRPIQAGALLPVYIANSEDNLPLGGVSSDPLVFGTLRIAVMGNAAPLASIPANNSRRFILITNISDTIGYFAFGEPGNLVSGVSATFRLIPWQTLPFREPLSRQQIYTVCGAANKNICYQEAS